MANIVDLHGWNLTPLQARQLQEKLRSRVAVKPLRKKVRFVAGLDCSIIKRSTGFWPVNHRSTGFQPVKKHGQDGRATDGRATGLIFAAAVVYSFPELQLVETATARLPLTFPYVPGLLSFREIPVCLEAIKKIKRAVDLWLIDGQGIAHPRQMGLASHLGLFLQAPTIGCAKSRLIGTHDEPGPNKGDYTWLYDKENKIGAVLRTRNNVKPLFISPGHLCSFENAIDYTLVCTTKYRLPEPTRIAHQTVSKIKTTDFAD